ncbi:MAG: tripartite tricarboxylate transporter TctB family protein [Aquisalimonadaceae bacterium]
MRRHMLDILSALVIVAAIAVMAWQSHIATFFSSGPGLAHDPVFYPRVVLAVAALLATAVIVQSVRGLRQSEQADPVRWGVLGGVIAATGVYVGLLVPFGYIVATAVFLVPSALVLGYRRWLPLLLVTIIFPLASWYVFVRIIGIPLPTGELFGPG